MGLNALSLATVRRKDSLFTGDVPRSVKMEEQVCVIWAGTNGYLDALPLDHYDGAPLRYGRYFDARTEQGEIGEEGTFPRRPDRFKRRR